MSHLKLHDMRLGRYPQAFCFYDCLPHDIRAICLKTSQMPRPVYPYRQNVEIGRILLTSVERNRDSFIGDFHDDVILLQLPESSSLFLSCLNFVILIRFNNIPYLQEKTRKLKNNIWSFCPRYR